MRLKTIINVLVILFMGHLFFSVMGVVFNTRFILGLNILRFQYLRYIIPILIFMVSPRTYLSRTMKMIYAFYAIYGLMWASGYYDVESQYFMSHHFSMFCAILIHNYYVDNKEYRGYAKVILATLIFVVASAILNIYQLYRFPEAARSQFLGVTGSESNVALSQFYASIGVAHYHYISAVPFVIPIIVYYLKNQKNGFNKMLLFLSIVMVSYSTFVSAITAPILMAALCLLFSIQGKSRFKASMYSTIILALVIAIIPTNIKAQFFFSVSDVVPNKDLSMKFSDLGLAIETGIDISAPETSIEYRAERIPRNIEDFMRNPILGTGFEQNAHIFWLNLLAQFGLIGTIPFILILYRHLKLSMQDYELNYRFYYLVSIGLFVALGFMKSITAPMMFYLLMLIPGLYYLRYIKREKPTSRC